MVIKELVCLELSLDLELDGVECNGNKTCFNLNVIESITVIVDLKLVDLD